MIPGSTRRLVRAHRHSSAEHAMRAKCPKCRAAAGNPPSKFWRAASASAPLRAWRTAQHGLVRPRYVAPRQALHAPREGADRSLAPGAPSFAASSRQALLTPAWPPRRRPQAVSLVRSNGNTLSSSTRCCNGSCATCLACAAPTAIPRNPASARPRVSHPMRRHAGRVGDAPARADAPPSPEKRAWQGRGRFSCCCKPFKKKQNKQREERKKQKKQKQG